METGEGRRSARRWCIAAGVALAASTLIAGAEEPAAQESRASERPAVVRGVSTFSTLALRHARAGARRRLGQPACQRVFRDFRDAFGVTLEARLEGLGESAQGSLDRVLFYDGSRHPLCQRDQVLAFTGVGSRAVFVCGARLTEERRKDPIYVEMVLIHEVLHSLGLGEGGAFPSSSEISSAVLNRCGT